MGRRRRWWRRLLAGLLFLAIVGYAAVVLIVPSQIARMLRRVAGDGLTVGQARVAFPLRLVLSDVALGQANPWTVVSSRQMTIIPGGLSWPKRTVSITRLEIEEPRIQVRRAKNGKLELPTGFPSAPAPHAHGGTADATPLAGSSAGSGSPAAWQVAIQTIQASGGALEFVDEKVIPPFRGSLTELSFVGGPVAFPPRVDRISLAIQGRLVGAKQHAASIYCSGWLDLGGKNLEASCQLEPLPLAAFEPYYQGALQVRVYDATLKATSHLTAKANALDGRVRLEIDNLSEGDLSVLGMTLVDVKKIAGDSGRSLTGEIQISGPMDRPQAWRFQLVPGNEIVQHLVRPLLNRGIEIIQIKVGQQKIPVGLTPATEALLSNIEAVTKQVQEALQIIAPTSPADQPPTTEAPPEATAPPSAAGEPSSAALAAPPPPVSPPEPPASEESPQTSLQQ